MSSYAAPTRPTRLPYEEGSNALHIQYIGIPGLQ